MPIKFQGTWYSEFSTVIDAVIKQCTDERGRPYAPNRKPETPPPVVETLPPLVVHHVPDADHYTLGRGGPEYTLAEAVAAGKMNLGMLRSSYIVAWDANGKELGRIDLAVLADMIHQPTWDME